MNIDNIVSVLLSPLGVVGITWVLTQVVKLGLFDKLGIKDKNGTAIKVVCWTVAILLVVVKAIVTKQPLVPADLYAAASAVASVLLTGYAAQGLHDRLPQTNLTK